MKNSIALLVLGAFSLISCQDKPAENKEESNTVVIGAFSQFPKEIDGCSCYFSADKGTFEQHRYFFVNDFGNTAFMLLDGKMTKLTLRSSTQENNFTNRSVYSNGAYEVTVRSKDGEMSGEETSLASGSISVKHGKATAKTAFYGECGC